MVVKLRNKNVPIFMLVGVCYRFMQSIKVYVDWEGETLMLKKWNIGGLVILRLCSFHQKLQ